MSKKVGFYLMNLKGFEVLKELVLNNFHHLIAFVVSSPDEDVNKDYYKEIKNLCDVHQIKFYDKKANLLPESDYQIAIGWRWLIKNFLNLIVLHDSILPKYRGFSPLVSALINGDSEIGVTALFASENADEGPIIAQEKIRIKYPIKIQNAIEIISPLYTRLVTGIISQISTGKELNKKIQDNSKATYSLWRDSTDYFVDWQWSSHKIKRFIDAVGFPYKGAATYIDQKKVRLLDSEIIEDKIIENRVPGKIFTIIDSFPVIVCGEGLLILKKIIGEDNKELKIKKLKTRLYGI